MEKISSEKWCNFGLGAFAYFFFLIEMKCLPCFNTLLPAFFSAIKFSYFKAIFLGLNLLKKNVFLFPADVIPWCPIENDNFMFASKAVADPGFLRRFANPRGEVSCYYRPQTKFAKVVFSQVSVCPQGGGLEDCMLGYTHPGQTPPPRQTPPWADTTVLGRHPSRWAVHAWIDQQASATLPTGMHSCLT